MNALPFTYPFSANEHKDGFQYVAIADNAAVAILSVCHDVHMSVFCIYMPNGGIAGLWTFFAFLSNA